MAYGSEARGYYVKKAWELVSSALERDGARVFRPARTDSGGWWTRTVVASFASDRAPDVAVARAAGHETGRWVETEFLWMVATDGDAPADARRILRSALERGWNGRVVVEDDATARWLLAEAWDAIREDPRLARAGATIATFEEVVGERAWEEWKRARGRKAP